MRRGLRYAPAGVTTAQSAFLAQAFNLSIGSETAEGRIVVDQRHLRFQGPTLTVEIPLTRLEIEIEEATAGRICFRDPHLPDWAICSFDAAILEHPFLRKQTHTRNQIREIRSRGEFGRRL